MSIFRFRVIFEDYDDIHRDIDLQSDHTFADLFNELLKSVGFDNKHLGTFYLADHNWRKGQKIGEISGDRQDPLSKVEIVDFVDDPHQKFLFHYDPEANWNFTIELIRIIGSPEYRVTYPRVAAAVGTPPVQYKETLIIPTRERTEPDGRGRKRKVAVDEEEDELATFLRMGAEDDEAEEAGVIEDSAPEEVSLELPGDMDLETDTEIAKLAEEFNNTTTIDETEQEEEADDEFGFGGGDDEEGFGEDDYGSGSYGGYDED